MNASQEKRTVPRSDSLTGSQLGMTLIEILVALGILAAVAVVFLAGMATSSKAVMISQERVAFDSLAKSQMEFIKSQDYINVDDYDRDDPTKRYQTIAIPSDLIAYAVVIDKPQDISGADANIQKITVTVTHDEKVFTLVGYKVKP